MLILLSALLSGYAVGKFMPTGWPAYAVCLPVSALVYFLSKFALASFRIGDPDMPGLGLIIATGALQAPLLMLGVFLARRSSKRNSF